ncbi:type I-E CRISPR-associated protein Cas7/Cse4/CasC [Fibrella aquatica]|uniref:type I-E CRISPR-associated protein Cas7/Cse4/CasC n=1 Tax=Fibrella aquatica TaxID=3242487 RepID=UPI00352224D8
MIAFAAAFIQARLSGKQNTFAAHSLPAFVLFIVREKGQPVPLVNASEDPIKPSATRGQSITDGAIAALSTHYGKLKKCTV